MYNPQIPLFFNYAGNPNGFLAGNARDDRTPQAPPDFCWDETAQSLWYCSASGNAESAVWKPFTGTTLVSPPAVHGVVSSGTVTFDRTQAQFHRLDVGGALTLAFDNWLDGYSDMFVELVNGGSATITFPGTIYWLQSSGTFTTSFATYGVTLQTSGIDFLVFWSPDGGATIFGKVVR